MFKTDRWIAKQVEKSEMIAPFVGQKVRDGVVSYGLGHYGYDLRLSPKAKMYKMLVAQTVETPKIALLGEQQKTQPVQRVAIPVDPKTILERQVMDFDLQEHPFDSSGIKDIDLGEGFALPPGNVMLGSSVEYLKIPDNVLAFGWGKSTYARVGLLVNITPIEPGWEGNLTLSITNVGDIPILVYPNEGIAQICFYECDERPDKVYEGKYQGNIGAAVAQVE